MKLNFHFTFYSGINKLLFKACGHQNRNSMIQKFKSTSGGCPSCLSSCAIGNGQAFDTTLHSRHSTLLLSLPRSVKSVSLIQDNILIDENWKNLLHNNHKISNNRNYTYFELSVIHFPLLLLTEDSFFQSRMPSQEKLKPLF